ncbi:MAG: hypothetical protein ACYCZV_06590 [Acidimicrobiales bacterium]
MQVQALQDEALPVAEIDPGEGDITPHRPGQCGPTHGAGGAGCAALGGRSIALGGRSIALGGRSIALGGRSIALGGRSIALGGRSIALGATCGPDQTGLGRLGHRRRLLEHPGQLLQGGGGGLEQ